MIEYVPNYDHLVVLDYIRANVKRNLPEVRNCRPHNHVMSVAGGGPSLEDTKDDLSGYICAINGSLGYLLDSGIKPNACGILDPSEHIADSLVAREGIHYYVASMAHPKVFEKLKGCHVIMWHASGLPGSEELLRKIKPNDWLMVGGGTTMGLRWINLGYVCGFRDFHLHGLDSSYRNGKTHAYPDHDRKERIVIDGRETSPNFIQQVKDYPEIVRNFNALDPSVNITLYGDGLLQDRYKPSEYWKNGYGRGNLTPRNIEYPEGEEFREYLFDLFSDKPIFDFGCGEGRLSGCFNDYYGYDICDASLEVAKEKNPDKRFGKSLDRAKGRIVFAHTVFLHIPDNELTKLIENFDHVIISEITGREYRSLNNPPAYNRDIEDYKTIFRDFELLSIDNVPYPYYNNQLSIMEFKRC